MIVVVRINYHTNSEEEIFVCGNSEALGNWDTNKALALEFSGHGEWKAKIEVEDCSNLQYKYFIKKNTSIQWEFGKPRKLCATSKIKSIQTRDFRRENKVNNLLFSKVFTEALFKPITKISSKRSNAKSRIKFSINYPRVGKNETLAIIGNQKALGDWKTPILLNNEDYPNWHIELNLSKFSFPIEYKYVLVEKETHKIESWEEGNERKIFYLKNDQALIHFQNDENFEDGKPDFKGAGVAVPIFSLRSKNGFGIGEFNDLKKLVDWSIKTNLKMIQVLPINETIATHSWLDSYPYKAISTNALHPMFLNLETMGKLKDPKQRRDFVEHQKELNQKPYVDYELVMKLKSKYLKLLYEQEWKKTIASKQFKEFFESNKTWLKPYAAFCFLRDKYNSIDFKKWEKWAQYKAEAIENMVQPKSKDFFNIAYYYFIQYHLQKQLKDVVEYAHQNHIALKGDLPIGVNSHSVETWTSPHLFNLNCQAGAPPDKYTVLGQNWQFPTYNWQEIEKEDFRWWQDRIYAICNFFDAFRMDHLLGFFRMWEIPTDSIHGLLGYFKPSIPIKLEEFQERGIWFDFDRFTKPYIRSHFLKNYFGEYTDEVKTLYFKEYEQGCYELKDGYQTQLEVYNHFTPISDDEQDMSKRNTTIRDGILNLLDEVLFLKDPTSKHLHFHPRIAMQFTNSYNELDQELKVKLDELYIHYFYERNESLWKTEAMKKLPKIVNASNMLVCGDDLGMIPESVSSVIKELKILSLEIQRMPKKADIEFSNLSNVPYLSVCSTSTHDMKTIRGWWEENREKTQNFFQFEMKEKGAAPYFAEPWICQKIIKQHLQSSAMWTIFPIQDLLAMDGDIRWDETDKERINTPSNPKNKWRYRMLQDIDDLNAQEEFNILLQKMIIHSKR